MLKRNFFEQMVNFFFPTKRLILLNQAQTIQLYQYNDILKPFLMSKLFQYFKGFIRSVRDHYQIRKFSIYLVVD